MRSAVLLALGLVAGAVHAQGPANNGLDLLDSVRVALARNPDVQVSSRTVTRAEGDLLYASSRFDTLLSASLKKERNGTPSTAEDLLGGLPALTYNNGVTSQVKASQAFRSGIVIEPSLSLSRQTSQPTPPGFVVPNRATLGLTVTVPLLKNAGSDVNAAPETAARLELDAVRLDRAETISRTTLNVVGAYWQYLAAVQQLNIAIDAENGTAQRASDTARLVQEELLPASERDLVAADQAAKRASRLAAFQSLVDARTALARLMGVTADEGLVLPAPEATLPTPGQGAGLAARLPALRAQALAWRTDLQAANVRYDEAEGLLVAARHNRKPQLDLALGVGVSGLKEGSANANLLRAAGANLRGPNAFVGLSYTFPVQNRAATGEVLQRQAALEQADIARLDLRERVLADVDALVSLVQGLDQQRADAERAVQLYAKSVDNEETRRKLGRGTLIDVLNVSDRLLQARQNLINVQTAYAVAIARLRHACGALVRLDTGAREALAVDRASLLTVP